MFFPVPKTNPPIKTEPPWDSDFTLAYAERACFDCHSNHTDWPDHSYFAPISWVVWYQVKKGREVLNFDELRPGDARDKIVEQFYLKRMPPKGYLYFHPEANFSEYERRQFMLGLEKTFGKIDKDTLRKHFQDYN